MNRNERAEYAQRLIARFKQLRDDEGWTQDTWAEQAGVSPRTVSDIYRGVSRFPNDDTLEKLAKPLGLSATPEETFDNWSESVRSFLYMIGLFLESMPPEERVEVMRDIASRTIAPKGQPE